MKTLTIFTTPTCPNCVLAKDYFNKYKIKYESVDVTKDKKALARMIELSGGMHVPVIANGDTCCVGFNAEGIQALLKL